MKLHFSVPTLIAACILSGCATLNESECREADWQLIGLEDGAAGRPIDYIGKHRKACADYAVRPDLAQYRAGHGEGLSRYCTPDNGFKQGRAGKTYENVCPDNLEGSFLAGYDTGRQIHDLEAAIDQQLQEAQSARAEKAELDKNLDNVENLLISGAMSASDRKALLGDFKRMQNRASFLSVYISDLEIDIVRMQREFDNLSASHAYY